jgi:hypothetical protein
MARVRIKGEKAGFIDTDGIKQLWWVTETTANILWASGGIASLEFDPQDAEFLRMIIDMDIDYAYEAIQKAKARGFNWREIEQAELQEDLEDYRAQRRALREQGIFHSGIEAGTFRYTITSDDGKSEGSGSFHFGGPNDDPTSAPL